MRERPYDIREYKRNLRERYKGIRRGMTPAEKKTGDARIRGRVLHLPEYRRCKTLLCFVSTEIEVDTWTLIDRALADGKTVAVPYCIDGTRKMEFYRIESREELAPRTFGVLEPDPERAEKITDFSDSICVLPGMSFDSTGYRLGYGGGYYDRFLSKVYKGKRATTVGVCYANCMSRRLPRGRYDVPCSILITEKYTKRLHSVRQRERGDQHQNR